MLLATAPRAVLDEVLVGLALVALEPGAVGAGRFAGPAEPHPARPALALALPLAEADEQGGQLVVAGVGEEGPSLALALGLAVTLENSSNASRRLVAAVAPPPGLGALVGPEQLGCALLLGQVLHVGEVVLAVPQRADGVRVRS